MAILDALTYIIRADASQLDQKIDDSEKRAQDLESGLKNVEKASKDSSISLDKLSKKALGYFGAYLSLTKLIGFVASREQFINEISDTSQALGIAIEDIDAFGQSVEHFGGSAEAARGSLSNLSAAIEEATTNATSSKGQAFARLGISIRDASGHARDAMQIMLDLAGAVQDMDRTQAIFNINQLGINDQKTIEMILRGRQEVERMMRSQREAGVVTQEVAERAREYNEAMIQLRQELSRTGNSFLDSFIPILTKLVRWFTTAIEWAKKHEHVLKGAMIAIAAVALSIFAPSMEALAVSTWAALSPWILIGLAVAAAAALFVLAYDDIMNFIEGNDSFIGQILEDYPVIMEIIEDLGDFFKMVFESIFALIDGLVTGFDDMTKALSAAAYWLEKTLTGAFTNIKNFILDALSAIMSVWDAAKGIINAVAGVVSGGIDMVFGSNDQGTLNIANAAMADINANPLNAISPGSIAGSRSEQNIQIDTITVNSQATDAAGISTDIGSELQDQLRSLQAESYSGFEA